ncbi:YfiT family bacillithiol transferase [Ammoniphilus sp. YIM 78166]|uniref:YfiT family bacillithiol transferase n=1 Tax=Ammoniphilus sp. YIM 78166 TaxID=1644106 RepID=UPI00106FA4D1|nr:bacillithiol transferase BstA [Ammoniphilus sp. YIM 78166]
MDVRYPVGLFQHEGDITASQIEGWIREIEAAPSHLRKAVEGLNDQQLDTPYRSSGWTVRQVVHHLADSHMNSYIRFKLALTEQHPTIKPYREEKWAELPDSNMPTEVSLTLLEALHERWVHLLSHLSPDELKRTFNHPDSGEIQLAWNIGLYAWHGRHHIAHITTLRERMGW